MSATRARTVVLDDVWPPVVRVDPVTGEVERVAKRLLTAGDPLERYPVPTDAIFDDGEPAEFVDAPDLEAVASAIIAARIPLQWLAKHKLTYLWKRAGGAEGGKARFGACVRPTGLAKFWGRADWVIWLAADHCRAGFLNRWQVEALVTHELLHCDLSDKQAPALKPHDFQGFTTELYWYGSWQADLAAMVRAAQQLPLFDGDEIAY